MNKKRPGFTLIELSIVLVIIGLIVGGVLVGQNLIEAAKIRAQVSELGKYKTAANAFQSKYNDLPGDMIPSSANQFGMTSRAGTFGQGDGNGLIQEYSFGAIDGFWLCGEQFLFWADLSSANLVGTSYQGIDGNGQIGCQPAWANVGGYTNPPQLLMQVPASKLGNGIVVAASAGGKNYLFIAANEGVSSNGFMQYTGNAMSTLTPIQALAIDTKIDDGSPLTGTVTAVSPSSNGWSTPALATPADPTVTSNVCVSNAAGNPYNSNPTYGGNAVACSLAILFR